MIFFLSSLVHVIVGFGCPFALQTKVASLPSLTTTSELVNPSLMSGGTENRLYYLDPKGPNGKRSLDLSKYLTEDIDASNLFLHLLSIDLAHVTSPV